MQRGLSWFDAHMVVVISIHAMRVTENHGRKPNVPRLIPVSLLWCTLFLYGRENHALRAGVIMVSIITEGSSA